MATFPQEIKMKTELQEKTTEIPLNCDHVTTMNFGEPNVVYYRHNTPREYWEANVNVFARPFPMQQPVLAKANHHLKFYYVPFRVLTPQWNAFINKEPYVPSNGTVPIQVQEMPYFTPNTLWDLLNNPMIARRVETATEKADFNISDSTGIKLTAFGRYTTKILEQLGYKINLAQGKNDRTHFDGMGLLAFAKVYMDFYYSSQWYRGTVESTQILKLFSKDAERAYEITAQDIIMIMDVCRRVWYNADYFTAQWTHPASPNNFADIGTISLQDITWTDSGTVVTEISNNQGNGTPSIHNAAEGEHKLQTHAISQYAIDALKRMSDYCARYAMAGVRAVDRYLARFGVLLSAEKMKRSVFYGEQITPMQMGAIYSTASTKEANIGDYAGTGNINSDNSEHKHWEIQSDEYGIILGISSIIPKIGYWQGIDRNNLHHEVETYFSGVFDQLGTQATSAAELYVSDNLYFANTEEYIKQVFGYIPRGAEYKTARDRLTGDFARASMREDTEAWHLFRILNDDYFNNNPLQVTQSPQFCYMKDAEQYLRIFNNTKEEDGDHFHCIYQIEAKARIHAKPLYDTYDFESEGKEIMLNEIGAKQN